MNPGGLAHLLEVGLTAEKGRVCRVL